MMRVRVTNPDSLFCGEEGRVLRSYPGNVLGEATHAVALDEHTFGEFAFGFSFRDSELLVLPASPEATPSVEVKS
jgi:hypothetical protein